MEHVAEGQTRILLRRVRSRHAARPLRVGSKEMFYRDPVIPTKLLSPEVALKAA